MRRENTKTWLHKNAANFRSLLPSGATKADFPQTSLSADMRETTAVNWQKNPGFLFLFLFLAGSYTNYRIESIGSVGRALVYFGKPRSARVITMLSHK